MDASADLSQVVLELVHPHGIGDDIAPGVRIEHVSTELGLGIGLVVDGEPLTIEVAPASEQAFAARAGRFAFSYRTEGDRNPVAHRGLELCRLVARLATENLERFGAMLDAAAIGDAPRTRQVRVSHALEPAGSADQPFYTLNPYLGCLIGCRFCYAADRLAAMRRLLALPDTPWGSYVDVRGNMPEVLANELSARSVRPIKFCPIVSDPYHAIENVERLTRRCLEVVAAAKTPWPVLLLTRSALVTRDIDVLASLPAVWVGVSLPTIDDRVRAHFEPRASSVEDRVDALQQLRAAGVRTFAVVQPLFPGSVDQLADTLASAVTSVSIDVLRGEGGATSQFDDPAVAECRDGAWQHGRAQRLMDLLRNRGVAVWQGELPPDVDAVTSGL